MPDLVKLGCPSCGAKLEIGPTVNRFACGYCGSEIAVQRGGGIVSLEPIAENIGAIRVSSDRTASELAIVRLKDEIAETTRRRTQLNDELQQTIAESEPKTRGVTSRMIGLLVLAGLFFFGVCSAKGIVLVILFFAGLWVLYKAYEVNRVGSSARKAVAEAMERLAPEVDRLDAEIQQLQRDLAGHRGMVRR